VTGRPTAVLWDMDGTIVDTEPYFIDAVARLVCEDGGELDDEGRHALVGASMADTAAVAIRAGARKSAEQIVDDVLAAVRRRLQGPIPWRPGALELLRAVRAAGVPTALVTMSFRCVAEAVVSAIPFDGFDAVVTGDEVSHGKPEPEAYLRAAELLGVHVGECVVIEDSSTGVAAGVAAGATVIAVPFYVGLPASPRYTVWDTLVGRDLVSLRRAAAARSRAAEPDPTDRRPA
jgi:HAD superfamily hydrolase (TIGR01509 family)